mmetsp:Transcript_19277/g.48988  ORF Transcript_19277/g.48988 Transcript_19277/m.48988 type:complete len:126 (+) Transcript_19277:56-433(+)
MLQSAGKFLARVLLAQVFFISALQKLLNFDDSLKSFQKKLLSSGELPLPNDFLPFFFMFLALFHFICGLGVIFNSKKCSFALCVFLVLATYAVHLPRALRGVTSEVEQVMKNVSIMGGLLLLIFW